MMWKIVWWIHASGRLHGGSDVVESDGGFDIDDAVKLIKKDLAADFYVPECPYDPFLPNFSKTHLELSFAARDSRISNWGVRMIREVEEPTE